MAELALDPAVVAAEVEQADWTLPEDLVSQVWQPRFPGAELCEVGAGMIPSQPAGHGQEGPSWQIVVKPGAVKVRTVDEARQERRENAVLDDTQTTDAMAAYLGRDGEIPQGRTGRVITEFSRKSVRGLVEALCSLDYTPMFRDPGRLPAVCTLTYPGCWLRVAPSGKAVKKHMKKLRKRYERAFRETAYAVWKQEFQDRAFRGRLCTCETCADRDDGRAPHVHLLMVPPKHPATDGRYFRQWLSETWADIVAHPDPVQYANHVRAGTAVDHAEGMRSSDPKRVAVYFTKHGLASGKQYQHLVPDAWQDPENGPGRFWGYWGLDKVEIPVAVGVALGTVAGRLLRRWSRAQRVTRQVARSTYRNGRADSAYPEVIGLAGAQLMAAHGKTGVRRMRTRAVHCRNGRGWVSVNDGASFACLLGLALRQWLDHRDAEHVAQYGRTLVARALALPAGPRRDALVARLRDREQRTSEGIPL